MDNDVDIAPSCEMTVRFHYLFIHDKPPVYCWLHLVAKKKEIPGKMAVSFSVACEVSCVLSDGF